MSMMFQDVASERFILAAICKFGSEAYYDICDVISESTFTNESNKLIYRCLTQILRADDNAKIDISLIQAAAHELGVSYILTKKEEVLHLQSILEVPIELKSARKLAAKIRKLEIAKLLHGKLEDAQEELMKVKGDESVNSILNIAEDQIFNFTNQLNDTNEAPKKLGDSAEKQIQEFGENPVDMIGVPSGLAMYDKLTGGLRPGVSLIGARLKCGKSMLAMNIGKYVSLTHNIPVLYIDSEMMSSDQITRIISSMSQVAITEIETGQYIKDAVKKQKVIEATKKLKETPFYHKNVSGIDFEEQLSIIRRFIIKEVGVLPDNTAKPCLIIYDYLKLLPTDIINSNLQEHQLLGLCITKIYAEAMKFKVPVLLFVQLNRSGINSNETDSIASSDKLAHIAHHVSYLRVKTDLELAEDGIKAGNRKLIPIVSRYAQGCDGQDYINIHFTGSTATMVEGKTKFELLQKNKEKDTGFIVENDDNEEICFNSDKLLEN